MVRHVRSREDAEGHRAKLNAATVKYMKQPEFQRILKDTGSDFVGDTPANFAAFTKAEAEKWGKVAKATGATRRLAWVAR